MKISILPRLVVLKSKLNNKFLQLDRDQGESQGGRLQFTADEVATPFTKFEVEPAKSDRRFVHLKCCSNNKYWLASPEGIVSADADQSEEDQSKSSCTLFEPITASSDDDDRNTFQFKNVSHGKYAVVWSGGADLSDAFTAVDWWKAATTDHQIKEDRSGVVVSRRVHSLQFHTFVGVISDRQNILISAGYGTNTSDNAVEATFPLNHADIKTSTWESSNSSDSGVETTLTSGTPFVTRGTIQVGPEETFSYQWGQPRHTAENVPQPYTVTVPPRSHVTVLLTVTRSTCEVPFSYTRDDTLSDGTPASYRLDDGVCTSTGDSDLLFEHWFEEIV